MINKVICDRTTKVVKGLNRSCYITEFIVEYEGDLSLIAKYDVATGNVYTLKANFNKFNAYEVLDAKYKQMLLATDKSSILADMFLDCSSIDKTDIEANTGVVLLELLPDGYAQTLPIKLSAPTKDFLILEENFSLTGVTMTINNKPIPADKIVSLDSEVSEIIIRFESSSTMRQKIKSYAIAY